MIDLKMWCEEKDILKRTIDAFWKTIQNYWEEEPEEYCSVVRDSSLPVRPVFDKLSYVCDLPNYDDERVFVDLLIEYDGKYIGWYRMVYGCDGEAQDDSLIIE